MSASLLFLLTTAIPLAPGQAPPEPVPGVRIGAPIPAVKDTAAADPVLHWNAVLLDAIRIDKTPPPRAARNLAILHVAIYDAVNAISRTHQVYHTDAVPAAGASAPAAANAAAHRVLVALYPKQKATFDRELAAGLAGLPADGRRATGVDLGRFIAEQTLAWRSRDDSDITARYTPRVQIGLWRPTPDDYRPALLPGWSHIAPFSMRRGTQRRPPGPPALTSAAYTAAFQEVKALGARDSTVRTPEQTEIARFWSDDAGTETPPGHWNTIARTVALARGLTLADNARLFAVLNVTLADAGCLCWMCKFEHEFWRPVTAIRLADQDGNPATDPDPTWTPLLRTPPFPSYTSGHSMFSAAAAAALAEFFGTDAVSFTTTSDGLPGVTRSFTSFSAAAAEAGQSRIYGGIHWQFDNQDGQATGRVLGRYVARYFFLKRRPGVPDGPLMPTRGEEVVGRPGGLQRVEVGFPPLDPGPPPLPPPGFPDR
jgi:hypothetical protein